MKNDVVNKFELVRLAIASGKKYTDQKTLAADATYIGQEHGGIKVGQSEISALLTSKKIVKIKNEDKGYYYAVGKGISKENRRQKLAKIFYDCTPKGTVEFASDVKVATLRTKQFRNQFLGDKILGVFKDVIIDVVYPTEQIIVFYYRGHECQDFEEFMHTLEEWRKEGGGKNNPPV